MSDIISEIAAASQEQSTGIDQVNQAVTSMDELTQQNAALAEETGAFTPIFLYIDQLTYASYDAMGKELTPIE